MIATISAMRNLLLILTGLIIGYYLSIMVHQTGTLRVSTQSDLTTAANFIISDEMGPADVEILLHSYMAQIQIQCPKMYRAGMKTDGRWDICLLEGVAPSDTCIVYSFGIAHDWSFDYTMANYFKCQVRAYDPTIKMTNHSRSENIKFFNIGLAGENKDGGMKFRTFKTLLEDQHFQNVDIDYLKFDIEGSEYPAIRNMFTDQSLLRVKQIGFEVHFKAADPIEGQRILSTVNLLEKMGFKKWKAHQNQYNFEKSPHSGDMITCCWELYYINERMLSS